MDFEAAANLMAALRPFTPSAKSAHVEGLERLVRAASRVSGDLYEVKRIMPARPVRSRPYRNGPESDGAPVATGEDSSAMGVAPLPDSIGEASVPAAASSLGWGSSGNLGPLLIFLVILLLTLEAR